MKKTHALLNRLFTAALIVSALALAAAGGMALFGQDAQTAASGEKSSPSYAQLQIQALDGQSNTPLPGVSVVIPETGKTYQTGEDGKTETITVPIIHDTHYQNMLAMPWGEITILAYKDGYIPYALFYVQVWENETRQGPNLLMFQEGATSSNQPFSLVEGPQRLWVNQLLEQYRP